MLSWLSVFLAGVILPFAFAPLDIYPLAFFAPAILLYQWQKSSPWQAFGKGWLFGLGFFGVGVSWLYISIHTYGGASTGIAAIITLLAIAFLALFLAVQGYLIIRLFGKYNRPILCLCIFPATWVIAEWGRIWPLNGFPWLFLGYSQINTPLRGIATIFGVYGTSLAVAIISGCLVLIGLRNVRKFKSFALLIIIGIVVCGWLLGKIQWTKPSGLPVPVSIVQANIPQSIKWEPEKLSSILQTYKTLTEPYWKNRLIIWPEAAIPAFPQQIPTILEELANIAKQHHSSLLFGIPLVIPNPEQYFNALLVVGIDEGEYRKRHLVAFGEYTPAAKIFTPLIKELNIPMSNFTPGASQQKNLIVAGVKIAPFICYEIAYPGEVLKYTKDRQVIINISDDSWFGKSMASSQQMEISRLRAVETGRFALLGGNTGVTAIIDPYGKIDASLPLYQAGVLNGFFTPMEGRTFLMRWGYYPVVFILILLIIGPILLSRGGKKAD